MQLLPLTFSELSLLLVVDAIILLITADSHYPTKEKTNLTINKKKLLSAAPTTDLLSLVTVVIRLVNIIIPK